MADRCLGVGICHAVPPARYCKLALSKTFMQNQYAKTFKEVKDDVEEILSELSAGETPRVNDIFVACGREAPWRVMLPRYLVSQEVGSRDDGLDVDLWVVVNASVALEKLADQLRSEVRQFPGGLQGRALPPEDGAAGHGQQIRAGVAAAPAIAVASGSGSAQAKQGTRQAPATGAANNKGPPPQKRHKPDTAASTRAAHPHSASQLLRPSQLPPIGAPVLASGGAGQPGRASLHPASHQRPSAVAPNPDVANITRTPSGAGRQDEEEQEEGNRDAAAGEQDRGDGDVAAGKQERGDGDAAAREQFAAVVKQELQGLISNWMSISKESYEGGFSQPITEAQAPGYYTWIKHPMDLGTMQKKLFKGDYELTNFVGLKAIATDFRLMINNCKMYNREGTDWYDAAVEFERTGTDMVKEAIRHCMDAAEQLGLLDPDSKHKPAA